MEQPRTSSESPDQPMSAAILQRAREAGAIDAAEIADLLNVHPNTAYNYFGRTELSSGQLRTLFRRARSDLFREIVLSDLLPGTGFVGQFIDADHDLNGDGVVDSDDALKAGLDQMTRSAETVRRLHGGVTDGRIDHDIAGDLIVELDRLLTGVVTYREIVSELRDMTTPRRKARGNPVGLSQ
ncbi:MAG: hypothetical protein AAGL98_05555 [Planctomycetota bacterium]